jgi:flagellar secretion chaperone FliS
MVMPINAYQWSRENEILSADPLKLIEMLYKAALESINQARRHLQSGEIRERSSAISKVSAILNELALSLDHERGGSISKNLTELYDYMQRQILKANFEQTEAPLIEVGKLLGTLLEGWETCLDSAPAAYQNQPETEYVPIACNF